MSDRTSYGKVTADIISQLQQIVGEANVVSGDETKNYAKDETENISGTMPEVVVKPTTTVQVSGILKLADQYLIPLTPRGSGTGLSGGAIPIYGGICLSLEKMNRILEIDEDNFIATLEPGVILTDLYKELEKHHLYYPTYPGELSASIGGNVATNAGGMRAVKYGVTRNFVLGLEAVLPTGEIIQTGGKYIKSSTAYDLTQLITGCEGTLAVITKVIIRLMPSPGQRYVALVPFNNIQEAIDTVPFILKEGILPMGIEFLEKDVVHLTEQFRGKETPIHNYDASLMIIVEEKTEEEANNIANRIGEICLSHNAIDVFIAGGERAIDLMAFREKAWPAIVQDRNPDIADVVVPRSRIAEYIRIVKDISARLGIRVYMVGHAGDGNIHLAPMIPETADAEKRMSDFFHEVFTHGIAMGGTISGEHGIGLVKKKYLDIAVDRPKLELMRRIKKAFDPHNIMNPGKIFDM
jgi:glycolate oxidase